MDNLIQLADAIGAFLLLLVRVIAVIGFLLLGGYILIDLWEWVYKKAFNRNAD